MGLTSEGRHLQIVHLAHRDEEGELDVVNIELEQRPPAYDLQSGKNDFSDVDVTDEYVTGDLPDILKKAEVEGVVLEPRDLQVAVDVSTVGVPVSKVPIVVVLVGRYGESAISTDADCKEKDGKIKNNDQNIDNNVSYKVGYKIPDKFNNPRESP